MKVGSLVVCIKEIPLHIRLPLLCQNIICPVLNQVLTVRGMMEEDGDVGIVLEEIVNPKVSVHGKLDELHFDVRYFRELELPAEVAEALERELVLV